MSRPWDGERVLSGVLIDALDDLGIPRLSDGWAPAHIQAIRALVAEFQWRIDFAEEDVQAVGAGPQRGDGHPAPVAPVPIDDLDPPVAPFGRDRLVRHVEIPSDQNVAQSFSRAPPLGRKGAINPDGDSAVSARRDYPTRR